MSQTKYTFYIGANNRTNEIETEKLIAAVSVFTEAFTLVFAAGCYKSKIEHAAIVSIVSPVEDPNTAHAVARYLADTLKQESIMLETEPIHSVEFIHA